MDNLESFTWIISLDFPASWTLRVTGFIHLFLSRAQTMICVCKSCAYVYPVTDVIQNK